MASADGGLDGVRLAVLNSRMQGVVRAMMNTLARTARSGVINTARDFSCCVLTGGHELLAMADSLPIHVMSGPDLMTRYMAECHPELATGDAFLHNSPYHGNSHAADHTLLAPVVDAEGRHRFTVLAKAHQADCGNSVPTTYAAAARDVYEEGALIFPCVRVARDYELIDDVLRMCEARIRVPEQWHGDFLALMGAIRIGERRLAELAGEYGWDTLDAYGEAWFDYCESAARAAIRSLPAGRGEARVAHDPFPGVPDGIRIKAVVDVDPDAERIVVDLTDNPDCQPCGLNLTEACSATSALVGVFNALPRPVPPNAGSFRRIEVRLRDNCVVGRPLHPASCSVATTNLADRLINVVQRAIAEIEDGIGMADGGAVQPPAWAVISGVDPDRGASFVNQIHLSAVTGGPAGPRADGWLTVGCMGSAGMMLRDSVEIDEFAYPIRILAQRVAPDTEGAGRMRGAPGGYVEYESVGCEVQVAFNADGSVNPAEGVRGGLAGAPARQFIRRRDGAVEPLAASGRVTLRPGERILAYSPGGGGYGPPAQRERAAIQRDVAEGIVSPGRARAVYRLS